MSIDNMSSFLQRGDVLLGFAKGVSFAFSEHACGWHSYSSSDSEMIHYIHTNLRHLNRISE
jgi:hypothetical protein